MNPDSIISFIHDIFDKTGKKTAVIALSGGIDSATSLMLTIKAIGPENVHAYHLPSKSSNPQSLIDARAAATGLPEHNFHIIPIKSIIQKSWRVIQNNNKGGDQDFWSADIRSDASTKKLIDTRGKNRMRLANIAARTRMMIIFDQAKKLDALVIGTENYSEHLLGYFTRFGDEASDIEPIGHLFKTEVISLAKSLEVPQTIINKPPSADLWSGQTDAQELGFTYDQADPILQLIDQHKTKEEIIAAGYDTALTAAVISQVKNTSFKHNVPYYFAATSF
jgi:NAD+ synthase